LNRDGSLLGLLHEMGHSVVNRRYRDEVKIDQGWPQKTRETKAKEERGSWGWALMKYREFLEQGINLAPEFSSREKIKDYVKESLLTHDIAGRAVELAYKERKAEDVAGTEFWRSVEPQDLDQMIDDFLDNPAVEFNDTFVPREEIKRSFGLRK